MGMKAAIQDQAVKNVWLEGDSFHDVNGIVNVPRNRQREQPLLKDIDAWKARCQRFKAFHNYREAKKAADHVAKQALLEECSWIDGDNIHCNLISILQDDAKAIAYRRSRHQQRRVQWFGSGSQQGEQGPLEPGNAGINAVPNLLLENL